VKFGKDTATTAVADATFNRWKGSISKLTSAEPMGDVFVLKFDKRVKADDWNPILKGFSIAGEDGKFYMAHARHAEWKGNNSANGWREIHVWSPLVEKPVAVRWIPEKAHPLALLPLQ
jgi:hypothetical protein